MSKPVIHLHRTGEMYRDDCAYCGRSGLSADRLSDDRSKITCKACLKAVEGKGSNSQKGDRPKVSVTIRIDAGINAQWLNFAKKTRRSKIDVLEKALLQYID